MPDYIMLRDLQAPREKRLSTLHGGGVSLDGPRRGVGVAGGRPSGAPGRH